MNSSTMQSVVVENEKRKREKTWNHALSSYVAVVASKASKAIVKDVSSRTDILRGAAGEGNDESWLTEPIAAEIIAFVKTRIFADRPLYCELSKPEFESTLLKELGPQNVFSGVVDLMFAECDTNQDEWASVEDLVEYFQRLRPSTKWDRRYFIGSRLLTSLPFWALFFFVTGSTISAGNNILQRGGNLQKVGVIAVVLVAWSFLMGSICLLAVSVYEIWRAKVAQNEESAGDEDIHTTNVKSEEKESVLKIQHFCRRSLKTLKSNLTSLDQQFSIVWFSGSVLYLFGAYAQNMAFDAHTEAHLYGLGGICFLSGGFLSIIMTYVSDLALFMKTHQLRLEINALILARTKTLEEYPSRFELTFKSVATKDVQLSEEAFCGTKNDFLTDEFDLRMLVEQPHDDQVSGSHMEMLESDEGCKGPNLHQSSKEYFESPGIRKPLESRRSSSEALQSSLRLLKHLPDDNIAITEEMAESGLTESVKPVLKKMQKSIRKSLSIGFLGMIDLVLKNESKRSASHSNVRASLRPLSMLGNVTNGDDISNADPPLTQLVSETSTRSGQSWRLFRFQRQRMINSTEESSRAQRSALTFVELLQRVQSRANDELLEHERLPSSSNSPCSDSNTILAVQPSDDFDKAGICESRVSSLSASSASAITSDLVETAGVSQVDPSCILPTADIVGLVIMIKDRKVQHGDPVMESDERTECHELYLALLGQNVEVDLDVFVGIFAHGELVDQASSGGGAVLKNTEFASYVHASRSEYGSRWKRSQIILYGLPRQLGVWCAIMYVMAGFALTVGAYGYYMGISSVICSNLFLFGSIIYAIGCLFYMHKSWKKECTYYTRLEASRIMLRKRISEHSSIEL